METLKPEELTKEDLHQLATEELQDDCHEHINYILQQLWDSGKTTFNLEDWREWYADLDQDERRDVTEGLRKEVRSDENSTSR